MAKFLEGVGRVAAVVGIGLGSMGGGAAKPAEATVRIPLVDCDILGDYRYVNTPPPSGLGGPGGTVYCPPNSLVNSNTGAVIRKPPGSGSKR